MFNVTITTPEATLFEGKAQAVELPAIDGVCTLLQDHAPTFIALNAGKLMVATENNAEFWFVTKGTCYFNNNVCTINIDQVITESAMNLDYILEQLADSKHLTPEKRQLLEAQTSFLNTLNT